MMRQLHCRSVLLLDSDCLYFFVYVSFSFGVSRGGDWGPAGKINSEELRELERVGAAGLSRSCEEGR